MMLTMHVLLVLLSAIATANAQLIHRNAHICLNQEIDGHNNHCLSVEEDGRMTFAIQHSASRWNITQAQTQVHISSGSTCIGIISVDGENQVGGVSCGDDLNTQLTTTEDDRFVIVLDHDDEQVCVTNMKLDDHFEVATEIDDFGLNSSLRPKNCYSDGHIERLPAQEFILKNEEVATPTHKPTSPPVVMQENGYLCLKYDTSLCFGLSLHADIVEEDLEVQMKHMERNQVKDLVHLKLELHQELEGLHRLMPFTDQSLCVKTFPTHEVNGVEVSNAMVLANCSNDVKESWELVKSTDESFLTVRQDLDGTELCASVMECITKSDTCQYWRDNIATASTIDAGSYVRLRPCDESVAQRFEWFNAETHPVHQPTTSPNPTPTTTTTSSPTSVDATSVPTAATTAAPPASGNGNNVDGLMIVVILVLLLCCCLYTFFTTRRRRFASLNGGEYEDSTADPKDEEEDLPFQTANAEMVKM